MRNLFMVARLKIMWTEFMRLNGFMFTKQHLSSSWRMASASNSNLGRPYFYLRTPDDRLHSDADGNHLTMKRDFYDQIIDFIGDYIHIYCRNIFRESVCTHPHEKVTVEWDGDRDCGYYRQHRCNKCHGYLSINDVDRYRPQDERHPELVVEDYIPKGLREIRDESAADYEEDNRHIIERDMDDEMSRWD